MKRLTIGLLAGAAILAGAGTAGATQTVTVDGVEATRVVIAPPQSDLERTIRDGLRQQLDASAQGTPAHAEAQDLYYLYGERHFEPLWLTRAEDGSLTFSPAAQAIVSVFEEAKLEGLDPNDYLTPEIAIEDGAFADPAAVAALETAFSAATLRYAQDAHGGRLDPHAVSANIDITPPRVDEAALMERLSAAGDPAAILMALHPSHPEFEALRDLLAERLNGEVEDPITIPAGGLVHKGEADPRIPLLRERLSVESPAELSAAEVYDAELSQAVEAFQERMGLTVDGIVGPATVTALNGEAGPSVGTIVANMERWRWMPEDLGDFNVFVNVPEFALEVRRNGRVAYSTKVIVGKQSNQTPIFSDEIRYVVTNPYWNVPRSILRDEVMPQVERNPGYLASQNMEMLYEGQVINAAAVNWQAVPQSEFNSIRVRQRPGSSNALGRVKFLFPNSHDVYLHDTNAPYLFARSMRALSHGCVRVEDPFAFAEALLPLESAFDVASLEGSVGGTEKWFTMQRHVPVHLAYFTLRVSPGGTIRAYGDLYGHDAKIKQLLGLN